MGIILALIFVIAICEIARIYFDKDSGIWFVATVCLILAFIALIAVICLAIYYNATIDAKIASLEVEKEYAKKLGGLWANNFNKNLIYAQKMTNNFWFGIFYPQDYLSIELI